MTLLHNPETDLTISRIIRAPRRIVWAAWTDPASLAQWFVPAPAKCQVLELDLRPGGSLVTQISEDDGDYMPHLSACFLAVDDLARFVFTDALVGGWRPAERSFMTAIITLREHAQGTEYVATVLHKNAADRVRHEQLGFYDGWGTVAGQLATFAERHTLTTH